MTRKKWQSRLTDQDLPPAFREKRKWQITLRRYVLERSPSPQYAPYFGLDIEYLRKWFECQFTPELGWDNFATKWKFDHIIPVTHFNQTSQGDLRLCWNFTNLRILPTDLARKKTSMMSLLGAKTYFDDLYTKTGYPIAKALHYKVISIERSEQIGTETRQKFMMAIKDHLNIIEKYSPIEFELLNRGRSHEEITKELSVLPKISPNKP